VINVATGLIGALWYGAVALSELSSAKAARIE
jgi:hypothetical protein